ncbi:M48 family metalloprotease [Deminuibacter soli]|uniref:Peptidase M48 Ste24p n=1 Tax=Deminuibacter soli TaxID=2291815 RepID=A0A3E1NNP6_9BACT|nr:M48 family metalloprotease [Deminuibacter soli]RFM29543.1 peptidase M48 Ste24p [Deminuibacter soli]
MHRHRTWLLFIVCCIGSMAKAQNNSLYTYQQLSKQFYAKQTDSLKKAMECPPVFSIRETQRKFREIWDEQTTFFINAVNENNYVHDNEVFAYVQQIVDQLVAGNKERFTAKPMLFVDRSPSVNAYAIGHNIIAVNLGIIAFAKSREELALAVAHELSHNLLNHADNAIKQRAEWITSDEYKKSMNEVLDSKYERLTRLRKVLENYSFSRSKHQRYHESDADSLAVLLLQKSNIAFNANFFLHLDSADSKYKQALRTPVKTYFDAYQLGFEEAWTQKRGRGLSARNYSFKDTSSLDDSLKTHPDCVKRYQQTLALTQTNAVLTPIPAAIHAKANKMLLWTIYDNGALTACLYRILLEKDNGTADTWYDFMLNNVFAGLYYADRELHRFNAIGITPKEYISKDYYALQTALEQMPRESLEQYCKTLNSAGFWQQAAPDEKAFKNFLSTLALDPDDSGKHKAEAAKTFKDSYQGSMYYELASGFEQH